jgi:hypothetical protein
MDEKQPDIKRLSPESLFWPSTGFRRRSGIPALSEPEQPTIEYDGEDENDQYIHRYSPFSIIAPPMNDITPTAARPIRRQAPGHPTPLSAKSKVTAPITAAAANV